MPAQDIHGQHHAAPNPAARDNAAFRGSLGARHRSSRPDGVRAWRSLQLTSAAFIAIVFVLLSACTSASETSDSIDTDTNAEIAGQDSDQASGAAETGASDEAGDPVLAATPEPTAEPVIESAPPAPPSCVETTDVWRTDLNPTGNRVASGTVDVAAAPLAIELPDVPTWVLPWGNSADWYVVLADGSAIVVSPDGTMSPAPAPPNAEPPELTIGADGAPIVQSAWADHALFTNPLPDTRVVTSGDLAAALVDPTDRYDHGVLGDDLEAGAVEILNRCSDERTRIEISSPSVIEGIAPLFADMDGDGAPEILITTSNEMVGARLEAWTTDGTLIARTDAIDRGRRWRNQLGVAATNPEGGIEIVDVKVPHIGGLVEFFRLDGDRLIRSAKLDEYTSHVLGSSNLDMGIMVDVTGDERPEVLVLSQDRQGLVALTRTTDGVEVVTTQPLDGTATTNISVQVDGTRASLAMGTSSGALYIWP